MKTITKIMTCCAVLALTACSQGGTAAGGGLGGGSSGGSGGGAGGGAGGGSGAALDTNFDTAFNAAINQGPTQTPITGTASYVGELNLRTVDATGAENGFAVGDLALAVDFDASSNPISGTATNFRGVRDGTDITIGGTLDTANSTSINEVTDLTTPLPTGGSITITNMNVSLRGDLTDDEFGNTYNAEATLNGPFMGSNGAASAGAAGVLTNSVGTNGIVAGGQYYVNKQ
jgi:hypothetical protein